MTKQQEMLASALKSQVAKVTGAIKSQVAKFSDQRLNDGDDIWHAREVELRCSVAATANAIYVALKAADPTLDAAEFSAACGLYVSDGRDNYSDCFPGELTWESKPVIKLTCERAREIYATKDAGTFGSFGASIEPHEKDAVEKMQRWLQKKYDGQRYIFWDEALAYIATGEVPPKQAKEQTS
jgi:hypothetical protein